MSDSSLDCLVVGAGISGLASAWFLARRGASVRVLEAASEPGGVMHSVRDGGFLVETGPNSTLARGGAFDEIVQGLGLAPELLVANPAAGRRYVVRHGAPVALPGTPLAFLATPIFSLGAKLRIFAEPFHRRADAEETIAQFVRRRLGPEFLDWVIDPFVSGVYAGDPERLSVRAAVPKIYALEARHGSLIVGALSRMLRGRAGGPQPAGRLVSFRGGMRTLPVAIARALGERMVLGAAVTALARNGEGWIARTAAREYRARRVLLALPAYAAAALLEPWSAQAARELAAIVYAPIAAVGLGFRRAQIRHALDGFGMLIPRRENRKTLGVLFSSTLFPGRAPEGHALLTAFIGGARYPGIAQAEDESVVERILADLRPLLGIEGAPVMTRVTRWTRAIPQYELGHLERLARLDAALAALPGLHLRANYRDGISVADCVENARRLAEIIEPRSRPAS
jgi:oxygen-dependent protoporphyrinogen oxidase